MLQFNTVLCPIDFSQTASKVKADLIVMGAQGTGGLELMLYGSNTQHVLRAAGCPVLTVRA